MTLTAFTHVTIDGFFAGPKGEIDWFHSIQKSPDFEAYTREQSQSRNTLFMGRTTYEMMESYWPTPAALKADPEMADVMDNSPKVVFSKKLKSLEEGPNWKNLRLVHEIERDEIARLKKQGDITILGSGSIVQQLTKLGLIDEYHLVCVPVVLGEGKPLFEGVPKTELKLHEARPFRNGVVVMEYRPA
jgi:dihydrofolate reductase